MATRQAGDEGGPAAGQAVLSSGSLGQLEHPFRLWSIKGGIWEEGHCFDLCQDHDKQKAKTESQEKGRALQPNHIQGADN